MQNEIREQEILIRDGELKEIKGIVKGEIKQVKMAVKHGIEKNKIEADFEKGEKLDQLFEYL